MAAPDITAALRRLKPAKRTAQQQSRPKPPNRGAALRPASPATRLLLDTNITIMGLAGTLPPGLGSMPSAATLFHSAVAVAEPAVGMGNRSPADPNHARKTQALQDLILAMPARRTFAPDAAIWAEAGLAAGILSRTQGHQPHQRKDRLNDALILLTVNKHGLPVLTDDHGDFDLLVQRVGGTVHGL